jgi:hypothetical protein
VALVHDGRDVTLTLVTTFTTLCTGARRGIHYV